MNEVSERGVLTAPNELWETAVRQAAVISFAAGVPAQFLPSAADMARTDLT